MIPEQASHWMQETGHWEQAAAELTDKESTAARDTLQQKLLDDWLARPRDPAIVGVPDDLLARAADTMITHTRKAITAVRQLGMLKNHEDSDIMAARKYTDMLLALPTLLLRAARRPEHCAQQKRQGRQHPETTQSAPASDEAAYPLGKDSISFSAVLRRRLQKAEKGELVELLHEAIKERDDEAKTRAADRLLRAGTAHRPQQDAQCAGVDKRFERAIAQAEAHNTRRALAVLQNTEPIPRDEHTRQAMVEKACITVPDAEQLEVIALCEWMLVNINHRQVTMRETKAALARLAARGTRAPGPSGGRTNLLLAMGNRPGGAMAIRDWSDAILRGLPAGIAEKWLETILEPCDQGPKPMPANGWPANTGPMQRRKVRPVTLAEMFLKLADDIASQRALPRVAAAMEPHQQGLHPTGLSKVVRCLRGWARQAGDAADADAAGASEMTMEGTCATRLPWQQQMQTSVQSQTPQPQTPQVQMQTQQSQTAQAQGQRQQPQAGQAQWQLQHASTIASKTAGTAASTKANPHTPQWRQPQSQAEQWQTQQWQTPQTLTQQSQKPQEQTTPARIILSTDLENAFCRMLRSRALKETYLVDQGLARWNAVMWRSGKRNAGRRKMTPGYKTAQRAARHRVCAVGNKPSQWKPQQEYVKRWRTTMLQELPFMTTGTSRCLLKNLLRFGMRCNQHLRAEITEWLQTNATS